MKPNNNYKHYPVRSNEGQSNIVPRFNSNNLNTPATIIPKYASKDHNVAGSIKTKIHLKNARGEEIDIYQNQQVLNLLNGNTGYWCVGSSNNHYTKNNKGRR